MGDQRRAPTEAWGLPRRGAVTGPSFPWPWPCPGLPRRASAVPVRHPSLRSVPTHTLRGLALRVALHCPPVARYEAEPGWGHPASTPCKQPAWEADPLLLPATDMCSWCPSLAMCLQEQKRAVCGAPSLQASLVRTAAPRSLLRSPRCWVQVLRTFRWMQDPYNCHWQGLVTAALCCLLAPFLWSGATHPETLSPRTCAWAFGLQSKGLP